MRIAHIVTYVSIDGAFGGPIAVASAQAAELASRGHTVSVIAGWDGKAVRTIPGVDLRLFKARRVIGRRLTGLLSLGLLREVWRTRNHFDVFHIHLGRDAITLPAAWIALSGKARVFLQTHGMIMPDRRPIARLLDSLATRRVLTRSSAVLSLTEVESNGLREMSAGTVDPVRIRNGVEIPENRDRVAAQTHGEVLFLARLHPRKRVMAFAEAALALRNEGLHAVFHVVGPDEGDLPELLAFVASNSLETTLVYDGPLAGGKGADRISSAAVYVLPSFGEVFPMTVLESLSVGTPVVMTSDCGIADELESRGAAVVTDGSPLQLAAGIRRILSDPEAARHLSDKGNQAARELYSVASVVDNLEATYNS